MGDGESQIGTPPFGNTLLHAAAFAGIKMIVEELIRSKCNVNRVGPKGGTVLHAAVAGGHLDICCMVVEAGCKVGAKTSQGRSALYFAIHHGWFEIAKYLVSQGADPYVGAGGDTPIALLRKIGGADASARVAELDTLMLGRRPQEEESSHTAAVAGSRVAPDGEDNRFDDTDSESSCSSEESNDADTEGSDSKKSMSQTDEDDVDSTKEIDEIYKKEDK